MRGTIEKLLSPVPVGATLPAMYQEDEFTQRFVSAFDELLAPVLWTLDSLEAYVSPGVAPADFLSFLATWVGAPASASRVHVASAVEAYGRRGTVRGLVEAIARATGVLVEVTDEGGVAVSESAGAAVPGGADRVIVRVPPDVDAVTRTRIEAVVAAEVPAHLRWRVEGGQR